MALWTDLIDPATLTGYARQSLADYEVQRGTLARWLPNQFVADIVVRLVKGQFGLVDVAKWRAYDAEPEVGKTPVGTRITLELPALGQNIPLSEYEQLRSRNAAENALVKSILKTTDAVVRAVADSMEYLRGVVLNTGIATIAQGNFINADDFGRPAGHTVTLTGTALWSAPTTADPLTNFTTWSDIYVAANGEDVGSIVMSTRAFRALTKIAGFQTQLVNGAARPATADDVRAILAGAGVPPIYLYDRQVSIAGVATKVVPDTQVLLLPAPVDPNGESSLGATFWGQTLTSLSSEFGIEDGEYPGIVAGLYRGDKPPMIAEVISDAIGMPVLANAALSFASKVL